MRTSVLWVVALLLAFLVFSPRLALGEVPEPVVVETAIHVMDEVMALPARSIPESLLAHAQAIAIIPNLVKGGFVIGVRYGRGVVLVRDENGRWKPPAFVRLGGGSVGYQVGVQATDVVLVFKTQNSVKGLMNGKFTLGVDAAAAAGPVGRQAAAATDATLKAEIYSYSRSRGLFVGVSLDGAALTIDHAANAAYYRDPSVLLVSPPPGQPTQLPPTAIRLLEQVQKYTSPSPAPGSASVLPGPEAPGSVPGGFADEETLRRRLVESSRQLETLLDDPWKKYLALPGEVYVGGRRPAPATLVQTLNRFESVFKTPQYRPLSQRAEFQATYELLRKYSGALAVQAPPSLGLPPPPAK
ncbi:MAG: lipid-binding SYLF domain-containing protein [Thermoguttaceae bacterium]